jgi:tRNA (guanosine-2'-O-)-methyltransferase
MARCAAKHRIHVAPLWPMHGVNPGTLLRTCDVVGACLAVPRLPWVRTVVVLGHERTGIPAEAVDLLDVAVEIPMVGSGASLNVAVAGSLVLYRLAGLM